ncbi:hypothetical protein [Rhodococcoides fascians]|uniref:hypothetical protein n=1 Tax=Rhodococcoides fascians TaxID=1828 RepID=UPI00068C4FA6|nr:hypothetical protein [Rhodococcus fascians]
MTQGDEVRKRRPTSAQYEVAGSVVAFAVAVFLRYVLTEAGAAQTAAFYVGIPAVVAVIVVLSAPSRSAVGITMKVITVLLLMSMMLLGEGFICVIFAAPIFYLIGGLVAIVVEKITKSGPGDDRMHAVAVPALVLVAVAASEGIVPATTLDGATTVSASRTLNADVDDVVAAWERPLDFGGTPLPGVLSWGFPEPLADSGGSLEVGARRTVTFAGAHHRPLLVSEHHWGERTTELTFEVVSRTSDSARLAVVGDTTPISSWLTWNVADISWSAVDSTHTAVDLELSYTRELAPAWYFGPLEDHVTERAAGWLLDSLDR